MKKTIVFIAALLFILGISFYGKMGNTRNVERDIGTSNQYTPEEIEKAMDVAVSKFKWTFRGCTLKKIWYAEDEVQGEESQWAKQYNADEAIVLSSDFKTGEDSWKEGFNSDSTYTDWQWVLVRSNGGAWKLETWGY